MPENAAKLAAAKKACGYVAPPQDLADAVTGKFLGDPEWHAVLGFFRDHTLDEDTAFVAFVAERFG